MTEGTKYCPECDRTRSVSEFYKNRARWDGLQNYCKECCYVLRKLNRPDEVRAESRRALLKTYGLSEDMYDELLAKQNYVCAICEQTCLTKRNLSIDHDHSCCPAKKSCGKCIRGLLCLRCNNMLGYAKDKIEILEKAIEYLRRDSD